MAHETGMFFNTKSGDFEFPGESEADPLADTQECEPLPAALVAETIAPSVQRGVTRASGQVRSAHSLLSEADLDWDPEFAQLRTDAGFVPAGVGRAVVRSDTKVPIGVVGTRYTLIPHRRLADLADALCAAGQGLRYGNAGHKANGARPFLQLQGAPRQIGKDARGQAVEVQDLLTLLTAHDGTLQAMACYGANVIVCRNTYAHALQHARARGVSIRHTAAGAAILEDAIRIAEGASEHAAAFDETALRLMSRKMSDLQMRALATRLVPGESTRAEGERGKLMSAWTSSPGAAPGTAWGAAQAVTYYTTHTIAARETTDRAFGLATGEGTGADLQQKAWWHLTTDEGDAVLQHQLVTVRRA